MAIVNGCCCWRNLRSGSFAAGFYALILYSIVLTAGLFQHFTTPTDSNSPLTRQLIFSIAMIFLSASCIITSVLLLIGLCVDSRALLIPWMVCILSATVLDGVGAMYVVIEGEFSNQLITLLVFDIAILGLNIYSLLCVYAQYKEYCAGRGVPQFLRNRTLPPTELKEERAVLYKTSRPIIDSAVTNSSTVSTVHSITQNDSASVQESSEHHKSSNDIHLIENGECDVHLNEKLKSNIA